MTRDASDDADTDRKERVLHTRIPAILERELKCLATNLRVPVSNVVRAILEDAVAVAELAGRKTEAELRGWAERLSDERARLRQRVTFGDVDRETSARDGDASQATEPEATSDQPAAFVGVIGYQPLVLAAAGRCARCGRALAVGEEVFVGVRDVPSSTDKKLIIGRECLPVISTTQQ